MLFGLGETAPRTSFLNFPEARIAAALNNEPNFINEEERKTFVSGFKKLNKKNSKANFNAIDVEKKHEFEAAVSLPNFGASGTFNLDFEKIKKMTREIPRVLYIKMLLITKEKN